MVDIIFPKRVHSLDEMFGTISKIENVENVICIVETDEGYRLMVIDGVTQERVNWLLDCGKRILHSDEYNE